VSGLYGYVVGGDVWGIGFTEEYAVQDAVAQLAAEAEKERKGLPTARVPDGSARVVPISIETAKRVANGDRRYVR